MAAEVDATHAGEGSSSEKTAPPDEGKPAVTSVRGPPRAAAGAPFVAPADDAVEPAPDASSVAAASWAWRMCLMAFARERRDSLGAAVRLYFGASE